MTKPKELTFYFGTDTIRQLEAIRDYVRSHYGKDIPLKAVEGVGVVEYIIEVAKAVEGVGVVEYIIEVVKRGY